MIMVDVIAADGAVYARPLRSGRAEFSFPRPLHIVSWILIDGGMTRSSSSVSILVGSGEKLTFSKGTIEAPDRLRWSLKGRIPVSNADIASAVAELCEIAVRTS